MPQNKILFILKRRDDFDPEKHNALGLSTGLFNSATFMQQMLNDNGTKAELEVVHDNNDIDRVVTRHRPTHCIIEALWTVPSKFIILTKLHPSVKWIIRIHSEMPFMAGEGMAMDWIGDYVTCPNVYVGVNAPRMLKELRTYIKIKQGWNDKTVEKKLFYLPNYYPQTYKKKEYKPAEDIINIGCFGAVRPLKNHLLQAIASLKFADQIGKKLYFHVNVGRIEMKGEPVLNNLKSLFIQLNNKGHQLVLHEWTPRDKFIELCGSMDIGLQVSFSETFNIVGADIISQGVPLVGSSEIPWLDNTFSANPVESDEIFNKLLLTHTNPQSNVEINQLKLTEYTNETSNIWSNYLKNN